MLNDKLTILSTDSVMKLSQQLIHLLKHSKRIEKLGERGGGGCIVQAMSRINKNNWVFLLPLILNLPSDLSIFALNPYVTYNIVLFTNNRTNSVHYTGMGTGKEKKNLK